MVALFAVPFKHRLEWNKLRCQAAVRLTAANKALVLSESSQSVRSLSFFTLFPLVLEGRSAFFSHPRGGGPMVLDCARRTSPFSGRAFREQEGLSGHSLTALDPRSSPPVQCPRNPLAF